MSRILKRPMFRTGGTPNEGIMHGLVDRRGYDNGGQAEKYADEYYSILSKIKPPAPRFPLGQIGLNLVSGEYAGDGLLANIARSAKGPYEQFVQADDATRGVDYQTRMTAAKMGISKDEALELAKAKAAGTSNMQKDYSTDRKYFTLFEQYTKDPENRFDKTVFKIHPDVMANYASYIKDEAMKTEKGRKFIRQTSGIVDHTIKKGKVLVNYDKLLAGGVYFDPTYNAFVQRIPRSDEDGVVEPEHIILIDPYTFEEVRKINLK
jgi:hypothetical protein